MAELKNLIMQKQEGAELCWAAAVKSVIDYYKPGRRGEPQRYYLARFGKTRHGIKIEANDPGPVLEALNALESCDVFNGDEEADKGNYPALTIKISAHIKENRPILCFIQGTGASNTFKHVVVIWKILELPEATVGLKDPSRPNESLNVPLLDLLTGRWNYLQSSDAHNYNKLFVYGRRFMFTKNPFAALRA